MCSTSLIEHLCLNICRIVLSNILIVTTVPVSQYICILAGVGSVDNRNDKVFDFPFVISLQLGVLFAIILTSLDNSP